MSAGERHRLRLVTRRAHLIGLAAQEMIIGGFVRVVTGQAGHRVGIDVSLGGEEAHVFHLRRCAGDVDRMAVGESAGTFRAFTFFVAACATAGDVISRGFERACGFVGAVTCAARSAVGRGHAAGVLLRFGAGAQIVTTIEDAIETRMAIETNGAVGQRVLQELFVARVFVHGVAGDADQRFAGTGLRFPAGERLSLMVCFDLDVARMRVREIVFPRVGRQDFVTAQAEAFVARRRDQQSIGLAAVRCVATLTGDFVVVRSVVGPLWPGAVRNRVIDLFERMVIVSNRRGMTHRAQLTLLVGHAREDGRGDRFTRTGMGGVTRSTVERPVDQRQRFGDGHRVGWRGSSSMSVFQPHATT